MGWDISIWNEDEVQCKSELTEVDMPLAWWQGHSTKPPVLKWFGGVSPKLKNWRANLQPLYWWNGEVRPSGVIKIRWGHKSGTPLSMRGLIRRATQPSPCSASLYDSPYSYGAVKVSQWIPSRWHPFPPGLFLSVELVVVKKQGCWVFAPVWVTP